MVDCVIQGSYHDVVVYTPFIKGTICSKMFMHKKMRWQHRIEQHCDAMNELKVSSIHTPEVCSVQSSMQ